MEILSIVIGLAIVGLASLVVGADSRPRLDDEPHRSL
jgi:hypothetical protein